MNSKEFELLSIFRHESKPLSLTDIMEAYPELSKNTTAKELSRLEKMGYLSVVGYGISNKTRCRKYVMTEAAQEDYLTQYAFSILNSTNLVSRAELCMAVLSVENDKNSIAAEINNLQNMLNEFIQKNNLENTKEDSQNDKPVYTPSDGGDNE